MHNIAISSSSLCSVGSPLGAALASHTAGLYPVPVCWPNSDGGCSCGRGCRVGGKAALVHGGWLTGDFKPTAADVQAWWDKWPQANMGVLLRPSQLLVIDCDSEQAVNEALALGLPSGPVVQTGKGEHRYYLAPPDVQGNTIKVGTSGAIDILTRGYVVAPPSRHPSGQNYSWLLTLQDAPLQLAPDWAVKRLLGRSARQQMATEIQSDLPLVDVSQLTVSDRIKALIREGQLADPDRYPSRSEAVFAVIQALVQSNHDDWQISSVLLDPQNGISEKPREQGASWVQGEISRARSKAAGQNLIAMNQVGGDLHYSHMQIQGQQGFPPRALNPSPYFRLYTYQELAAKPPPTPLVVGHLYQGELSVMSGPAESFKTFVALDLALSIASGHPWLGLQTRQGGVLYVAAEGAEGIALRMQAWSTARKTMVPSEFRLLPEVVEFMDAQHVKGLLAELADWQPALIIIDTLARTMIGGDENSSQDMGRYISGVDQLRKGTGGHIMLIHHFDKGGKGIRGSSALPAAVHTQIDVRRNGNRVRLICQKQKNAAQFQDIELQAQVVYLGTEKESLVIDRAQYNPSQVYGSNQFNGKHTPRKQTARSLKRNQFWDTIPVSDSDSEALSEAEIISLCPVSVSHGSAAKWLTDWTNSNVLVRTSTYPFKYRRPITPISTPPPNPV